MRARLNELRRLESVPSIIQLPSSFATLFPLSSCVRVDSASPCTASSRSWRRRKTTTTSDFESCSQRRDEDDGNSMDDVLAKQCNSPPRQSLHSSFKCCDIVQPQYRASRLMKLGLTICLECDPPCCFEECCPQLPTSILRNLQSHDDQFSLLRSSSSAMTPTRRSTTIR